MHGGFAQASVDRMNAQLRSEDHLSLSASLEDIPSQRTMSDTISKAYFDRRVAEATGYHRARLNAFSAPGVNRWLQESPSKTLDKHLSGYELITTIQLSLGVDVYEDSLLCRFCATPLDCKGIRPNSCTAGGDCTLRHNEIRNKLFKWAKRARLNPELEKAGVFNDNTVLCMRRPADVLVNDPGNRIEKVALDVKVINALGAGHMEKSMRSSLEAADAYRLEAMGIKTRRVVAWNGESSTNRLFLLRRAASRAKQKLSSLSLL